MFLNMSSALSNLDWTCVRFESSDGWREITASFGGGSLFLDMSMKQMSARVVLCRDPLCTLPQYRRQVLTILF